MPKEPKDPKSITDQIKELRRELAMRHQVYPNQVVAKKLTQEEMLFRVGVIENVIAFLEAIELQTRPTTPDLFQQ